MSITVSTKTVTPAQAAKWLSNNKNRSLRGDHVKMLTHAITAGQWTVNGASIVIDVDGTLRDGQHRCAAIVAADMPVRTIVVEGVPAAAQETMDSGLPRRHGDLLLLRGEANSVLLGSALRVLWRHDNDLWRQGDKPTFQDLLEVWDKHPGIAAAIPGATKVHRSVKGSISTIVAAVCLATEVDPDAAGVFFEQVATGENLVQGDPAYALRRTLGGFGPKRRAYTYETLGLIGKAWNAYRDGREIKVLAFKAGEVLSPLR